MSTHEEFRFCISSPPDRKYLVAEIFWGEEQVAEISRETSEFEVELYPRRTGQGWHLNFDEFINVLSLAKGALAERFD
ncbi:MAG: hypothetical protein IPN69_18810 [Acidobacteria bacterium]|nr:hypothetical protein [Acidobacteriota bacterium]MBK8812763.1 hypothetical protein [Acidobacteriota bacterium]